MAAKNLRKKVNPAFITSAAPLMDFPDPSGEEYVITAHSDVEKSSFIPYTLKALGPSCTGKDRRSRRTRNCRERDERSFGVFRSVDPGYPNVKVDRPVRRGREQWVGE